MRKKQVRMKSKSRPDQTQLSEFFHQLADKIATGEIVFQQLGEDIAITLPETVQLQVKVTQRQRRKGTRHKVLLKLSWLEGEDDPLAPPKLG
ncbi:MAG TPA: amphi-Trp domain-containing protein [Chloroflexi bacterium]|nr:amphi-Trp domain-containing protein [Chloroflexota bacterium]